VQAQRVSPPGAGLPQQQAQQALVQWRLGQGLAQRLLSGLLQGQYRPLPHSPPGSPPGAPLYHRTYCRLPPPGPVLLVQPSTHWLREWRPNARPSHPTYLPQPQLVQQSVPGQGLAQPQAQRPRLLPWHGSQRGSLLAALFCHQRLPCTTPRQNCECNKDDTFPKLQAIASGFRYYSLRHRLVSNKTAKYMPTNYYP
jgi:hypothetical protein